MCLFFTIVMMLFCSNLWDFVRRHEQFSKYVSRMLRTESTKLRRLLGMDFQFLSIIKMLPVVAVSEKSSHDRTPQ